MKLANISFYRNPLEVTFAADLNVLKDKDFFIVFSNGYFLRCAKAVYKQNADFAK